MTKVHAVCSLIGYRFGLEFQSELLSQYFHGGRVHTSTGHSHKHSHRQYNSRSTHLHIILKLTHHDSCSTILFLNQCYTWKLVNGTFIYIYYRLLIHSSHCFTGKLSIKIHSNYNGASEHALLDSNPDFAYFLLVLALFE